MELPRDVHFDLHPTTPLADATAPAPKKSKAKSVKGGKPREPLSKEQIVARKTKITQKKTELSNLKQQAEALRHIIHNHPPKDAHTFEVAGQRFSFSQKSKGTIAQRMQAGLLLKELKKKIRVVETDLHDLEKPLEHRAVKIIKGGVGIVPKVFDFLSKHGVEGRIVNAESGVTTLLDPLTYYIWTMDHVWSAIWAIKSISTAKKLILMNELIGKAQRRLVDLDIKIGRHSGSDQDLQKLKDERLALQDAVKVFKEERDRLPVDERIQQTLGEAAKLLFTYIRMAQGLCFVLPLFIQTTATVLSSANIVLAVATIPLSVLLSIRGVSQSIRNLRDARKDMAFTLGIKNEKLANLRDKSSGFGDILTLPELNQQQNAPLKAALVAADQQVSDIQEKIKQIDDDLLNARIKDKNVIKQMKADRQELKDQIGTVHDQLRSNVANLRNINATTLEAVSDQLIAKKVLLNNTIALESTLLPHLEQKLQIKTVMHSINLFAEGVTITASTLIVSGLILSPFSGVGVPLIIAGATLGFVRLGIQFPLSLIVKRIIMLQKGKNRIDSETFNEGMRQRFIEESKNWEVLEKAGAVEDTASFQMFNMLKKHYASIPSNWTAKEWAHALANDPPGGEEWKHFDHATKNMRNRSEDRYLGENLVKWASNKLKQLTSKDAITVEVLPQDSSTIVRARENKYEVTPAQAQPGQGQSDPMLVYRTNSKMKHTRSYNVVQAIHASGVSIEHALEQKDPVVVSIATDTGVQKYQLSRHVKKKDASNVLLRRFFKPVKIAGVLTVDVTPVSKHVKSDIRLESPSSSETTLTVPLPPVKKKPLRSQLLDQVKSEGLFQDPYTLLSSRYMQEYADNFSQRDLSDGKAPEYCIQKVGDKLTITTTEEPALNAVSNRELINEYRQHLTHLYGEEKVQYIEYLYDINLVEMAKNNQPLLPDTIYKFNIGVGNVEIQDIKEMAAKLQKLSGASTALLQDIAEQNQDLSIQAWRGIFRHFEEAGNPNPTLGDLKAWMDQIGLDKPIQNMSPQAFNAINSLLSSSPEEREQQYTGRKIAHYIHSSYSIAGEAVYKPWVDQQELLQSFDNIQKYYADYSVKPNLPDPWEYYTEVLAHVICKKHLARPHPTEDYRVGALIPAPPNPQTGEARWYVVSGVFNNSQGNFNYSLEPACKDPTLPAIKLFRSTASAPYAMDGGASVVSDLNPLNSPGYLGSSLLNDYEKSFFQSRTIPLWSAYGEQASEQLQGLSGGHPTVDELASIHKTLAQANIYLQHNLSPLPRNLFDIVKQNDYLLLDLAKEINRFDSKVDRSDFNVLFQYKSTKIRKQHSPEKQLADANKMRKSLDKLSKTNLSENQRNACKNVIAELDQFIHPRTSANIPTLITELKTLDLQIAEALSRNDTNQALSLLNTWNSKIQQHALATGEDSNSKSKQDILYVGHSLGGAIAQRYFVEQTLLNDRIPLSGNKAALYAYDAPGINRSDNRTFMEKARDNTPLLEKSNVHLEAHIRYEAGDFIPGGGGDHVGSVKTEPQLVSPNVFTFDCVVNDRLKVVKNRAIGLSESAHATQFASGTPGVDFHRTEVTGMQQYVLDHPAKRKVIQSQGLFKFGLLHPSVVIPFLNGIGKAVVKFPTLLGRAKPFHLPEHTDQGLHRNWIDLRDNRGVFAVTVGSGVVSTAH